MRKLLLALVLCALPATAIAQTYPQTNSNVQGQAPTNSSLTNTNPVIIGCQAISTGSPPAASTTHNGANESCDDTGVQFTRPGTSQPFNCALSAVGTSLTQCAAISTNPYRYFITDITVVSTTATAAGFALETGSGTNCATSTTFIYPSASAIGSWFAPGNTSPPEQFHFAIPIFTGPTVAVCVVGTSGTNTINIQVSGYLAL